MAGSNRTGYCPWAGVHPSRVAERQGGPPVGLKQYWVVASRRRQLQQQRVPRQDAVTHRPGTPGNSHARHPGRMTPGGSRRSAWGWAAGSSDGPRSDTSHVSLHRPRDRDTSIPTNIRPSSTVRSPGTPVHSAFTGHRGLSCHVGMAEATYPCGSRTCGSGPGRAQAGWGGGAAFTAPPVRRGGHCRRASFGQESALLQTTTISPAAKPRARDRFSGKFAISRPRFARSRCFSCATVAAGSRRQVMS